MKGDLNMSQSANSTKISFDWVEIPSGEFLMGSNPVEQVVSYRDESPQHQVDLPEFFMSAKPITNTQYEKFVKSTGHKKPGHWIGGVVPESRKNHPVTYIDWADANQFAKWCGVRFPTEAEWEFAARCGSNTNYGFGDNAANLATYGWYAANADGKTHNAGQKLPNACGLHDMHGNVWEWCWDIGTSGRRIRGGSWDYDADNAAVAYRVYGFYPDPRDYNFGFRLVRSSGN